MLVLVLKIEAPMASFGGVAVNETRPTELHPSKSMITGLLANALGLRRERPEQIQDLQDGLMLASRVDREPSSMVDYQIAFKAATRVCKRTGKVSFLHKENVWSSQAVATGSYGTSANQKDPFQLYKQYLTDVSYTVAVTHSDEKLVKRCASAVQNPARPLFLGRKGCFPSRPLYEDLVECPSLVDALHRSSNAPGVYSVRTELCEKDLLGHQSSLIEAHDLKDWGSNLHMTKRRLAEGLVPLGETQ